MVAALLDRFNHHQLASLVERRVHAKRTGRRYELAEEPHAA